MRAIVVCGFLIKLLKKHILKIWKKLWVPNFHGLFNQIFLSKNPIPNMQTWLVKLTIIVSKPLDIPEPKKLTNKTPEFSIKKTALVKWFKKQTKYWFYFGKKTKKITIIFQLQWIFDLRKFLGTAKNFPKSKIFLKSNT